MLPNIGGGWFSRALGSKNIRSFFSFFFLRGFSTTLLSVFSRRSFFASHFLQQLISILLMRYVLNHLTLPSPPFPTFSLSVYLLHPFVVLSPSPSSPFLPSLSSFSPSSPLPPSSFSLPFLPSFAHPPLSSFSKVPFLPPF